MNPTNGQIATALTFGAAVAAAYIIGRRDGINEGARAVERGFVAAIVDAADAMDGILRSKAAYQDPATTTTVTLDTPGSE